METDIKIQELLKKVEEKKAAIKSAEKPSWETNCSFKWENNSTTNLHVADEDALVSILAYLNMMNSSWMVAATELFVGKPFTYSGFTYDQWKKDIKTRLNTLRVSKNKKDLSLLEERLNDLMSPELKKQKALDEIAELLKD